MRVEAYARGRNFALLWDMPGLVRACVCVRARARVCLCVCTRARVRAARCVRVCVYVCV